MYDPQIDVQAIVKNIDRIRDILIKAEQDLPVNHHNLVRASVIDELIVQALSYANTMK